MRDFETSSCRIIVLCIAPLLAGCGTSNKPKAPVALTWEMGASDIEPGYYENPLFSRISPKIL